MSESIKRPTTMLCSKWLVAALVLGIPMVSCAAPQHRYECPALLDGQAKHPFLNVEVYEGPVEDNASLMGDQSKKDAVWEFSKPDDIYLVCGYRGTDKTITVHAPGVSICKGTESPLAAFCD